MINPTIPRGGMNPVTRPKWQNDVIEVMSDGDYSPYLSTTTSIHGYRSKISIRRARKKEIAEAMAIAGEHSIPWHHWWCVSRTSVQTERYQSYRFIEESSAYWVTNQTTPSDIADICANINSMLNQTYIRLYRSLNKSWTGVDE